MSTWYVYLIRTKQGTLYTGITTNPARRIRQHSGIIKGGAKALRGKSPLSYQSIFEVADKSLAMQLEAWIKSQRPSVKNTLNRNEHLLPLEASLLPDAFIRQMNEALR